MGVPKELGFCWVVCVELERGCVVRRMVVSQHYALIPKACDVLCCLAGELGRRQRMVLK